MKDKKKDKRVRDRDPSQGGSHEGGEVSNTRKRSHQWVYGEFWNFRGEHNREGKKKKNTEYMP